MSSTTDIDILKHFGGISKNSLKEICMSCDDLEETIDIISHSPYIETDYICQFLRDYTDSFGVLTLNVQRLNAKFNQLKILLDILAEGNIFLV